MYLYSDLLKLCLYTFLSSMPCELCEEEGKCNDVAVVHEPET
jgi:hypothetical protein